MLDIEYLYLGGPFDGQWRRPLGGLFADPGPERYFDGASKPAGRYIPTKFGHMAMGGAGNFRMQCTVMLDEPWHDLLTDKAAFASRELHYAKSLERALTMQAFRENLQRTWTVPEVLDFGPAWMAMERRPTPERIRPIRDNPQA